MNQIQVLGFTAVFEKYETEIHGNVHNRKGVVLLSFVMYKSRTTVMGLEFEMSSLEFKQLAAAWTQIEIKLLKEL